MSDERLRRRVAEIASVDEGMLSDAARERILGSVMMDGPSLVRNARWKRLAAYGSGPVLALAAGFAFFATRAAAPEVPRVATKAVVPAAPEKTLACAGRPSSSVTAFAADARGSALDLGEVALAVADPGTKIHTEELKPCRTVFGLDRGRVTVHAKNLGGGELSVKTDGAMVTVRGTVFAVTKDSGALVVEVAEGTVAVTDGSGEHLVHAGGRFHSSNVGIAEGPLDHERERELRATVNVPEVVGFDALKADDADKDTKAAVAAAPRAGAALPRMRQAPEAASAGEAVVAPPVLEEEAPKEALAPVRAEGPADWLTQAEQARKAGKFADARTLYRKVAESGSGATAEAAWVALARMELSLGHPAAARDATKRRQERFGHGTLEPEALWIDVRTYRQSGDAQRARDLAEELVRRWPASPQARAAQQWLSGSE